METKAFLLSIAILSVALNLVAQTTGTFTDARDGKIYKTVKIGNQIWMAENLAYKADSGCWVFNNDQRNVKTYGYLYNWDVAKKICPAGWHLPSDTEWDALVFTFGGDNNAGNALKSTKAWANNGNGTNSSGFSALPGGLCTNDGTFGNFGTHGSWWCSSEYNSSNAWLRDMNYVTKDVYRIYDNKICSYSVRCVKDK